MGFGTTSVSQAGTLKVIKALILKRTAVPKQEFRNYLNPTIDSHYIYVGNA
jgi:hypothetical protein